jgi:thiosulfate/3-mercaptopyruvate sulfurtransferase
MNRTVAGLAACLSVVAATSVAAGPVRSSMVVTTAWVSDHLRDPGLVLLHVGEKKDYDEGHLPGAQWFPREAFGVRDADSGLTLQLPPATALVARLESLGVSDTSRVVLYFGTDWVTPTARAYFTLDYLGLGDRTSIMDGGLPAWRAEHRAVTTDVVAPPRGRLIPHLRPELVASLDEIRATIGKSATALIDSRLPRFFDGTDPGSMPRAGHIPGARNLPFSTLIDADNRLKDVESLRRLYSDAGADGSRPVVTYCHIGQQASLGYFVARYLGFSARLYDGSFEEWSRLKELPVATGTEPGGRGGR